MRAVLPVVTIVTLACASPSAATAQPAPPSPPGDGIGWTYLDALGYGGLGFGLALLATSDMEGSGFGPPGEAVAVVGAATAAGVVGGVLLGRRTAAALAEGRRLGDAHRAAAIGGVVLAGGTLGALASVPLINGEGEGTPLGSDEETVVVLVGAGAILASLYVWTRRDALGSRAIRVAPTLVDGDRYGVSVRVLRSR